MEFPSVSDPKLFELLEGYRREIIEIERKLSNDDVPSGKKEKLGYRLSVLHSKIRRTSNSITFD